MPQEWSTDLRAVIRAALADRFDVGEEIGTSLVGAAIVYRARDLGRSLDVALKILRPELVISSESSRFAREIRITQSLHHPNVLPLLDSGIVSGEGGLKIMYLALPLVEGKTLSEIIADEGQLPIPRAIEIIQQIAEALQYAHDRHVVHRDVKPENILVATDGRVLLADFGIAHAMSSSISDRMTITGMVIGTPAYMSPEQVAGDRIDARSDQYSLAMCLYECLAGRPPFDRGGGASAIMQRVANAAPSIKLHRTSTPDHVAAAIGQALQRLPADRFATVNDFRMAIATDRVQVTRSIWGRFPTSIDERSCFVLMPFGAIPGIQEVYRDHVVPIVEECGLKAFRADDIFSHGEIIRDVWYAVARARLLIADVTGRNANVFYELGMAHAIGKDVIITAQSEADVPFDVRSLRYIAYEYSPRGVRAFETKLRQTLQRVLGAPTDDHAVATPLSP